MGLISEFIDSTRKRRRETKKRGGDKEKGRQGEGEKTEKVVLFPFPPFYFEAESLILFAPLSNRESILGLFLSRPRFIGGLLKPRIGS